jgi:hypothetical protein
MRYLEADNEFVRYVLAGSQDRANLLKERFRPDLLIVGDLILARRITVEVADVLQAIDKQPKLDFSNFSTQAELVDKEIQVPLFIAEVLEPTKMESLPTSPGAVKYVKGDRVFNKRFGLGTVVGVKQFDGQVHELVIDFDLLADTKTLVVTAVQLA